MAWDVISTLNTPTSGAFTFTSLTLSTYKVLSIEIAGVTVTTDGTDIKLTFYVGGVEVTGTSYMWALFGQATGGTTKDDSATGAAAILLNSNDVNWDVGNAATKSFRSTVYVDDPSNTTLYKRANITTSQVGPNGEALALWGTGIMADAGAINGVKIGGTSNLVAGFVRLLGLA